MDDIIFRKANINDISFLVDVIIEAEKSGTDVLPYSAIFGLTEWEVRNYLAKMLNEEIDGCGELSISSYLLAEKRGEIIAAACCWIEGEEGIPSSILKGNLVNFIIPKKAIKRSIELQAMLHELHFDNIASTIFIGPAYVTKENRGNNLSAILKDKIIFNLSENRPEIREVYVETFSCNKASLRTNEKLGFEVVRIKESFNSEIIKYLPSNKKILQKKKLNN